jgi:hypothetical protein
MREGRAEKKKTRKKREHSKAPGELVGQAKAKPKPPAGRQEGKGNQQATGHDAAISIVILSQQRGTKVSIRR